MTDAAKENGQEKAAGFLDSIEREATAVISPAEKVYVYEGPLRAWHWLNALCIIALCITGYLIGEPLPTVPGEASDNFLMGYVRMVHFSAGQIMAVLFVARIYWAFAGNSHAKQVFLIPVWSAKWWGEVWHEIKWYGFIAKQPKKYIGHNPLAQLAMFTMLVLPTIFMICTGFALYAEGQGTDSLWYTAFGWVFGVFGYDSFSVHTFHHLGMWVIIVFALVHIYAAFREDVMSRQSLISTMVSGWRYFKDDRDE